ncbi:hypothetical protein [Peribacillus loiseleuriae]|uniref:hypothetical protein n=1 Tax=Peribacillus loiseleuriae TaxID=1679170 RepID=UPI003D014BCE
MKTEKTLVTITEEMVLNYEVIFGKQNKLPLTFPMIFYRYINVPWDYKTAPIHRKQTCVCHSELSIGESYHCVVTLDQVKQKGKYMFYIQSLVGYNLEGSECFRCVSELVVH